MATPYRKIQSMSYPIIRNSLSPIREVEEKVRRRYERLNLRLSFEGFRACAAAAAQSIIATTTKGFSAQPNPSLPRNFINQGAERGRQARRSKELLLELEYALFHCMVARLPTPKPLLTVLNEALRHCAVHDAHLARHAKEDEASRLRCARGGQARHRDHRRIQCLTIRFLRTKAPASMWKSKSHAAETIGLHLCMLGIKNGFAVSKSEETWARNVGKMIRTDSRAAEIFQRHCTPRRSNRCRRIPR